MNTESSTFRHFRQGVNVDIKLQQASVAKVIAKLEKFAAATGRTAEDGIKEMAKSAGKRLIEDVQPKGTNTKVGKQFQESIGGQIFRAIRNANVTGKQGTAAEIHRNLRRNGSIPRGIKSKGQYKRKPIEQAEREALEKVQKAKAGRAKGAWLQAVDSLGLGNLSGMPKWINRHRTGGYGKSTVKGSGLNVTVSLHNNTPYITNVQSAADMKEAQREGYKRGLKRIGILTRAAIKKFNDQ